jgi:predicted DNA-binding transcriptional regulator YafY
MSQRESIARHMIIIRRLRKSPATYNDISDILREESELQGFDFMISKRTLQRDIADIASLYGIEISFDFSRRVYFMEPGNDDVIKESMAEAFEVFYSLNLAGRLSENVFPEERKGNGTEMMTAILSSIRKRKVISFSYFKFEENEETPRTAEPYALREFRKRWYLVARDLKDGRIKSFALDRTSELKASGASFRYPEGFNAREYYRDCFGIFRPWEEEEPEEVILAFEPFQGMFIKSLPVHSSQEILRDDDKELRIRLKLFITHDFIMELLSYGANVRAVFPVHLAERLKETYKDALKAYRHATRGNN